MITARQLVDQDPVNLLTLTGVQELSFESGEIEKLSPMRLVYQRLYWDMYRYPFKLNLNIPITHDTFIGHEPYKTSTHLKLLAKILWAIWDNSPDKSDEFFWNLSLTAYETTNLIHNFTRQELKCYNISTDITDYCYLSHPEILDAKSKIRGPSDIADLYKLTLDIIENEYKGYERNCIRRGIIAETQSPRSVCQAIGVRGYTQDVDGTAFVHPITNSYTERLSTAYDAIIESSSAKKAFISQDLPLKDSEYFGRIVQLATGVILHVENEDCGTQHYVNWYVEEARFDAIKGKYYLNPETNQCEMIGHNHRHLIGQVIKLRSITQCANPNPAHPCKTCVGHAARIIPEFYNLGHVQTIAATSSITGKNMSVKHYESSLNLEHFPDVHKTHKYLYKMKDAEWLLGLKQQRSRNIKVKLRIPRRHVRNINLVFGDTSVRTLAPATISYLSELELIFYQENSNGSENRKHTVTLNVRDNDFASHFTHDFLEYIKQYGFKELDKVKEFKAIEDFISKTPDLTGTPFEELSKTVILDESTGEELTMMEKVEKHMPLIDFIEFELEHWDYSKSIFTSARKVRGFESLFNRVKSFLLGNGGETTSRKPKSYHSSSIVNCANVEEAIRDMFDVMSPIPTEADPNVVGLDITFAEIEVWVRAAMNKDSENLDFRLPRAGEPYEFIKYSTAIANRGVGGLMAFQHQNEEIGKPSSYISKRAKHAYDNFIYPDPE